jgi:hypothetical protein
MRVGLDFDNTIVSYDALFHRIALEGRLIPDGLTPSKLLVRDHLRSIGKEDLWTEMQGLVYGTRIVEAEMFPGAKQFMRWARSEGIDLCIVSHKTRYPFLGPKHDLHAAARAWIERFLRDESGPLIDADSSFFELTKEGKCARIDSLQCDWFLDDLPELLTSPDFPKGVQPVLFDPDGHHAATQLPVVNSWAALRELVASEWQRSR